MSEDVFSASFDPIVRLIGREVFDGLMKILPLDEVSVPAGEITVNIGMALLKAGVLEGLRVE